MDVYVQDLTVTFGSHHWSLDGQRRHPLFYLGVDTLVMHMSSALIKGLQDAHHTLPVLAWQETDKPETLAELFKALARQELHAELDRRTHDQITTQLFATEF